MPKSPTQEKEKTKPVDAKFNVGYVKPTRAQVKVTVEKEKITEFVQDKLQYIKENVPVRGYRRGMAPESLIKRMFKNELNDMVLKDVLEISINEFVEKRPCNFISQVDLIDKEIKLVEDQPLNFTLEVDVLPEIKLNKYKGFDIELPSEDLKKDDIDAAKNELLENVAEFIPADNFDSKHWEIVCDIKFIIEGEKQPLIVTNISLNDEADQITFYKEVIPVPTKELVKLKKEETLNFEHTVSNSPLSAIQGKKMQIELKLKSVKHKVFPKVTAALVKSLNYDDLEAFESKAKEIAKKYKESLIHETSIRKVDELLLKHNDFELPDSVINYVIESETGIPLLDKEKNTVNVAKHLTQEQRIAYENAVMAIDFKLKAILNRIAEIEKIKVDDKELEAELSEFAKNEGVKVEELKSILEQRGELEQFKTLSLYKKIHDFICKGSNIKKIK
ncbi:MAG: hypothetical protein HY606_14985 [Planctomycetes bacterium]|nr:hypothetical protein [Planctomycetota bacterium]